MQHEGESGGGLVSIRTIDIVVALIMAGIGVLVVIDSLRLGAGWAGDGPQSGYFPFYIGLFIIAASLGTIAIALFGRKQNRDAFVNSVQLRHVVRVLVPTAMFIALVGFTGIYVASALFIGASMRWLGRFRWPLIVLVSVAVPFTLFLLFEIWFLVPLPKGPLEDLLGY
ncbi:tripartite tricarboxylate transporter TctB family protein [Dongia deserti]|uniref:tripartite tricarboxylate transporter TctB family protein n=1 Tax=Dongia deserti TaxID=2268030 RepID=UPI000E6571FD|nr:tripartite tricarboxylate transporter TctB family protein [Dongia deserti]